MNTLRSWVKRHPAIKGMTLATLRLMAPLRTPSALLRYAEFLADRQRFVRAGGRAAWIDSWPCLADRTQKSGIDAHYFHQAVWAARLIAAHPPAAHVDIGSDTLYVGMLTAIVPVTFVDIRPLDLQIADYTGVHGSILAMPFNDCSVLSLSCLHVIEHIGLGRYGDPIDPDGSVKAAREIVRIIAPGGRAYVSMPIGRPRVQFNGQRVFDPVEVLQMFAGLTLNTFAMVDATGAFFEQADPRTIDLREAQSGADCGLGMYCFTRAEAG